MEIKKVGVVGCGLMGGGICQICAAAGYDVTVTDISQDVVDKGIGSIKNRLNRRVEGGKIEKQEMDSIMGRIKGTVSLDDFRDCDLVVEAVAEQMEIKKQVFASLDKVCKKDAILASNTSSLSIIDMAAVTKRMERVLGIHFGSPPTVMRIIETIRTIATSDEVVELAKKFSESLDMYVFVTRDYPGFVLNTIQIPMLLQAARVLEEGLATKEEIDQAMTKGMGHHMGPISVLDYMGIDVALAQAESIYEETKNMIWAPPLLLRKMVTAGWLGEKTGKGFYEY